MSIKCKCCWEWQPTEHEKLEIICKKIWFRYVDYWYSFTKWNHNLCMWKAFVYKWRKTSPNVREIIFIQKFKDKYVNYLQKEWIIVYWSEFDYAQFLIELNNNLDNPVSYLYNLIKNDTTRSK